MTYKLAVLSFQFSCKKEPTIKNFLFLTQGSSPGCWAKPGGASRKVRWNWLNISVNLNLALLDNPSSRRYMIHTKCWMIEWEMRNPSFAFSLEFWNKPIANKRTLDFDEQFYLVFPNIWNYLHRCWSVATAGSLLSPSDVSGLRSLSHLIRWSQYCQSLSFTQLTSNQRQPEGAHPSIKCEIFQVVFWSAGLLYVITCYAIK